MRHARCAGRSLGAPTEVPACAKVTKTSGTASGPVNDPVSIQPPDNDGLFRIVDCKYMYNLATGPLSGTGGYKVELVINGVPVPGAAFFDLRSQAAGRLDSSVALFVRAGPPVVCDMDARRRPAWPTSTWAG
jgi:hypothetical protein